MKDTTSRFFIGNTPRKEAQRIRSQRFFYGLRSDGEELVLGKVDAYDANDGVQVNKIGDRAEDDFPYFIPGSDFFEGIDVDHVSVYPSLLYQQYKFSDGDFIYYVDENGELTLRTYQGVDDGDVLIPDVPLNPRQVDYRKSGVYPTFDNTVVTFDNSGLSFDNKEP
jgi:hypothetical protein